MTVLITILHVLVAVFLILVVLLQSGKGAEVGASFGGASQTIFGSGGAATLLSKLTTAAAVIFMITSLSLTMLSRSRTGSVMPETVKGKTAKTEEAKPAVPAPDAAPAATAAAPADNTTAAPVPAAK